MPRPPARRRRPTDAALGGYYYFRARHYSPMWGRFLQTDPLSFSARSNLYAYVDNDPPDNIDPNGICPQCLAGAAVGVTIGLAFQAGTDLWNWRVSSFSECAGAVIGGAAGGAAATVCGPACAGAVGAAASNLVANSLNGTLSASGSIVDTAIGAGGGVLLGQAVPSAFKTYVSNEVKGVIGEGALN